MNTTPKKTILYGESFKLEIIHCIEKLKTDNYFQSSLFYGDDALSKSEK